MGTATTIGGVSVPAGSTIAISSSNSGSSFTKTYTNLLGQAIATQQSGPSSTTLTSTAQYDDNGRVHIQAAADGSITQTDYSPVDGSVAAAWKDVGDDGTFTAGTDDRTTYSLTPVIPAQGPRRNHDRSKQHRCAERGGQLQRAGLSSSSTVDGQTSTTSTVLNGSGGRTVTTYNPDGSFTEDTYTSGVLSEQDSYDNGDVETAKAVYGYDKLGRNNAVTQYRPDSGGRLTVEQTTTFTLRADGSVSMMTLPGGRTQYVDQYDGKNQTPDSLIRTDGQEVYTPHNGKGQVTEQYGAGVLPASFSYDSTTGQVTDLTLHQQATMSGSTFTDTTGLATTHWDYDPRSGQVTSKTYGYGSSNTIENDFAYNTSGHADRRQRAEMGIDNFSYDGVGRLTESITHDTGGTDTAGQSLDDKTSYDDKGRAEPKRDNQRFQRQHPL